ncbi:RagB/SusD family nutrient uptake outer membrane protein [Subsaximicrobium wynnwilliamsii]|uniref:RagB/SusD family nutrient uptake outer membrane protein n=1 Tax=Subsaximicrobium wynnwilliamsii TaxID=291179 RepID=A0A5C6ZDW3_9FLAO|nr:RagB/SusD family nutrient uptake outer membrane protein [Subsaximicrobium wynnwilliamsii]TXD81183.1 RagB/SusD family nutrient uptake outer membrane protein [Subsaximicrobium wynnwilliamsii]TXD87000.1 RagB/SusD family nutrient uptake outer membrane protein [Subsaximicrobium wynnwilliamsii]TXE00653.1 RagB/SusD family nutrient uptake outer membrane protein [Subsaximicrobium wynnwilliamsii]
MNFIHLNLRNYPLIVFLAICLTSIAISCEDFVEVDPPNNQLTGETIFSNATTANTAFVNIYGKLRDNALTTGGLAGLPYLMGLYTDELELFNQNLQQQEFYSNNVTPSNFLIQNLWNESYNLIYATNTIIKGVENSNSLSLEDRERFLGEAYFTRAFIHFYLVNSFGTIPYIKTTDFLINKNVTRDDIGSVYQNIIDDLILSRSLLSQNENTSITNLRPNQFTASALLSRVYLYTEQWQLALNESEALIANSNYTLNTDTEQVFFKTSNETIWQYDSGQSSSNTLDAQTYIFTSSPPPNSALAPNLVNSFEPNDQRFTDWLGSVSAGTDIWYYPFKYKLNTVTSATQECTIVFRLAEFYLIAAEANAQLGAISNGLNRLNAIRTRANLEPVTSTNTNSLLNAIYRERKIELFTEMSHRFFDLKRTGRIDEQLSQIKPNWQSTDKLLPLPESELILNTNLLPQNDGY